ncbi:MAG: hypothetical protein NTW67_00370 [Candidatus Woesearchaeota archaeon]|nr:hypothetical protein [Candidatus Woesearchaeota archaeon]
MAIKKAVSVIVKKKRWIRILAPKLFNEQPIGESYVEEPQQLVGRNVTISLMILTNDPQKQAVNVSFKIIGSKNDTMLTELIGYKMLPAAAKKMMRRQREKIDDSFIVESSDKKIIRIKSLIITRGRTTGSVMATMRKLQRAYLAKTISQTDGENLIRDIVQKKIQYGLSQLLKRVYPVGACEIRQLEFIPPEKVKELGLKITLPPEKLPEIPKKEEKTVEEKTEPAEETTQTAEQPAEETNSA